MFLMILVCIVEGVVFVNVSEKHIPHDELNGWAFVYVYVCVFKCMHVCTGVCVWGGGGCICVYFCLSRKVV